MSWFNDKQQDRRKPAKEGEPVSLPPGVTQDRRKSQRREYFRVIYPIDASPEITNLNAKVIDISIKAVRFELNITDAEKANLAVGKTVDMQLKFHNGEQKDIAGVIVRQLEDQFGKRTFVCLFVKELSPQFVNKEQAYLIKHFPDFCQKTFLFKPPTE
ncbi:MAG: PilZ domain-containing protein [Planctomycetaceae bacterium]|nr:PilZ domain-containing protein [Planctomycetaceae bacterium]